MANNLSPIEHMPPELLCEIFRWCVEPYQDVSTSEAPLVLLGVCKRWRAVVLTHSRLWTNFSINITELGPTPPVSALQQELHCAESSGLSVSVKVEGDDPYSYHALYHARPILEYFDHSQSVQRWKNAVLAVPSAESFLKGLFKSCHPILLESLHVDLNGWDTEGTGQLSTFLSVVPRLQDLSWTDGDYWGVSTIPTASFLLGTNIPWHNLTRLVLNIFISLNTTYHMLPQCADLRTLKPTRFAHGEIARDLIQNPSPYPNSSP
ncbi:hypothetical protein AN958_08909 [Leucoagaricus sp. SymC.cos]|nr:hypothetical protein AN958_08909 [Leucoagaricus sp. SymC.cos]